MGGLLGVADDLSLRVDVDSGLRSFPRPFITMRSTGAGVRCFLLFAAWTFLLHFVRAFPPSYASYGVALWVPTRKVEGGGPFAVVHRTEVVTVAPTSYLSSSVLLCLGRLTGAGGCGRASFDDCFHS